ncbi:protein nirF [Sedimentimonas flavescens]|uniref:Protein nirF n=1 Tax=Sedimentimonas flavescens TaxID=2851012 RepID=A0ABT3A385_9RHOB|nr:cytochrome D1 domain-containing protein [Sedimentimonas flavescens]MBW0157071.1 protein nirF [Sedimentimonas flavescens]MCT2539563.1 protein nirF [Sedimentimonas flavescens]MCV2880035.1 protein nirF [Sedimentimonas flavescens]WBL32818.1 protein nirF [Sinirhodobacter sp. HNIBRBA609]
MNRLAAFLLCTALTAPAFAQELRATGDLGVVVERATGSVLIVDQSERAAIGRVEGFGDLSHASLVFSADERFAYIFGRDGGLTKLDLLTQQIVGRVVQAGNSIGGAISDDGKLIAVANYEPGGVNIFDAETLEQLVAIPAGGKALGLEDAPGRKFVFSVWDTGETKIVDMSGPEPKITTLSNIGAEPYDALVTDDGRTYIAGLFGEDGLTSIDLWAEVPEPRRILPQYGRGKEEMPVYKMPHLEGWAKAGDQIVLPAIHHHEVLWIDSRTLEETGRTATHGQPVFAMARPGGRQVWVNFAHPDNDTVQVIDSMTHEVVGEMKPGPAVLHMEFTSRGTEAWVSVRDENKVVIYDTTTLEPIGEIAAESPSGIFFTARAHRLGL